jgi:hypothetical protein
MITGGLNHEERSTIGKQIQKLGAEYKKSEVRPKKKGQPFIDSSIQ